MADPGQLEAGERNGVRSQSRVPAESDSFAARLEGETPVAEERVPDPAAASLSGEVIGYSGYRLPQFSVQASPNTSDEGAMTRSALTDENGRFQFDDLPPYDYRVHHVFHSSSAEDDLPLIHPPAIGVAVYLEQPTLLIRCVGLDGEVIKAEDLFVRWSGKEERSVFSSQAPPQAQLKQLSDGRTLAILDKPGPWRLLAYLDHAQGELRAVEHLLVEKEHREITLPLSLTETRIVTIALADSSGVSLDAWTAEAWHADLGLSVEEFPQGSHRLKLPFGSWKVRLKPTEDGYLSAFDADVEVGSSDPDARTESVTAPSVWGRFGGEVEESSSTYHLTAVHESGGRYGFTPRPKVDGVRWRSRLLKPGSYTVSIRRVPAHLQGGAALESRLEIHAVVRPGATTSLDLSSQRFR